MKKKEPSSKDEKKKKTFHWWFIPLGLVGLVVVLVLAMVIFISSMLPWQNVVAATSNGKVELSEDMRAFAVGGERDYSTLPDVLTMADGSPITTVEQFETRKAEILAIFEDQIYGALPKTGFITSFEVVEEGEVLDGTVIRKQIKITVGNDKGTSDALMLMYLPKSEEPVPVVIGLNSNGNHCAYTDEAIIPAYTCEDDAETIAAKRGEKSYRWAVEQLTSEGYGIATIYSGDFAPDNGKTYNSRVISLFDEEDFKAVGAWAFGLSRAVDYMYTDPAIDTNRIALIGHSRLGKAAVWAGANDTRVALVISNDSGNTGASLSRGNHGETVKSINLAFGHWFSNNYKNYGDDLNSLPVDQHQLLACIAPRHLYVASAYGDLWADPDGAWNSLIFAKKAFELYGLETISGEVLAPEETQTEANMHLFSESIGYHIREGWHEMQEEDWALYIEYMNTYLPGNPDEHTSLFFQPAENTQE